VPGEELLSLVARKQIRRLRRVARQLGSLPLDGLEEPNVLDRDDDVVGERLDQPDLCVDEGPHLVSRDRNRSDRNPLAQHRDAERGPEACDLLEVRQRVLLILEYVVDVHDPLFEQRPADDGSTFRRVDPRADQALVLGTHRCERCDPVLVRFAFATRDVAGIGIAEADRAVDHRLEDGIEVELAARDGLNDVAYGGGALLGPLALQSKLGGLLL
jgi:hypothetical protein